MKHITFECGCIAKYDRDFSCWIVDAKCSKHSDEVSSMNEYEDAMFDIIVKDTYESK